MSFLAYLKHPLGIASQHLTVVPKPPFTLGAQIRPMDSKHARHHPNRHQRRTCRDHREPTHPAGLHHVDICLIEQSAFKKFSFEYIVIDVAHGIKNVDSIPFPDRVVVPLAQEAVDHRYPLQNSLKELFTVEYPEILWIMRI